MTLVEFLASDPAAKVEYDKALAAERTAGKAEAQAVAKKVAVYLTSDVYASVKPIRERALKALSGEASVETVESAVAMFDLMNEQKAQSATTDEQKKQPETPGQTQPGQADILAKAAAVGITPDRIKQIEAACAEQKMDFATAIQAEIHNLEIAKRDLGRRPGA